MKTIAVNADNDLFLGPGGCLAMNAGLPALIQKLEHLMQSLLGEMHLARDRGLPYRETIWSGAPNLRLFEAYARKALLREEGVQAVESLQVWKDAGSLSYRAVIRSPYGTAHIGGSQHGA